MKKFPVTIVDNFYENPEIVREFALSQTFYPSDGLYPGLRTESIHILSQEFFTNFCEKLFSLFYDLDTTKINWIVETKFQNIPNLSKDKDSKFNVGWVHSDKSIFSGIIYLSKNSSGTSIYYPKNEDNTTTSQDEKRILYSGKKNRRGQVFRGN